MPPDPRLTPAGVVLPLRSFTEGKARLASRLGSDARAQLVRRMADCVADAAGDRTVVVVSDALDVRAWADDRGFTTIADPGSLNAAADTGRAHLRALGLARVVIAHADLPFATTFDHVAGDGERDVAVIVPCHRDDGTPVLSLPVDVPFRFQYGAGSFARHCTEAQRVGLETRVVRDPALAFDVDVPDDLAALEARADARPSS
jgi:2-phospho-L-lactate/phosphoenolpyruvate guanylyltransferase